jgi:hypothetical protein
MAVWFAGPRVFARGPGDLSPPLVTVPSPRRHAIDLGLEREPPANLQARIPFKG